MALRPTSFLLDGVTVPLHCQTTLSFHSLICNKPPPMGVTENTLEVSVISL